MGGCKKTQVGPALKRPADPERQKQHDRLKEIQLRRGILNFQRAGMPVEFTTDLSKIRIVVDEITLEENGDGLKVFVEGTQLNNELIAGIETRQAPGRDPQIRIHLRPRPFHTTTDKNGKIKEKEPIR